MGTHAIIGRGAIPDLDDLVLESMGGRVAAVVLAQPDVDLVLCVAEGEGFGPITFTPPIFGEDWRVRLQGFGAAAQAVAGPTVSAVEVVMALLSADGWRWNAQGLRVAPWIGAQDVPWDACEAHLDAAVVRALRQSEG
jgi:hypothetical protein